MSADRRRLTLSVLLSLLFHAVLLSLTFDGQGPGFPGIGFPWQERRAEVPDLRLVILPAQATGIDQADKMPGEPLPQGSGGQPLASGPTLTLAAPRPPSVDRPAEASADAIVPPKKRVARVRPKVESLPVAQAKPANDAEPAQDTKAEPERSSGAIPEKTLERASASEDGAPTPMGAPAAVVAQKPAEPTAGDAAAPSSATPVIAVAPDVPSPMTTAQVSRDAAESARERRDTEARRQADELARLDRLEKAAQQQAAQADAARLEAERQESVRIAAERAEIERKNAERSDAERQAAARLSAARQEAAQREAAQREAAQREAAQREAAQREAAQREAAQREAAQ